MAKKRVLGVVGMGHVGAHVAYALAIQGIADELVLVDQNEQKLASEVQDLRDAVAYMPHRVTVRGGDFSDLGVCDVIVNSVGKIDLLRGTHDRVTEMDFTIPAVRGYAEKIKASGFDGVLINITNPCDIVTRELALHLGLPRGRVFGTGTGLDTSRLLSALARQTGLDHKSITCYMMGEHGNQQFAPWSCVSFRGVPLDEWAKTDERFRFDRDALQKESIGGGWVTFSGKFCTEYGIADNDSPRLSADRLEYTLGNAHLVFHCPKAELKRIFDDIFVGKNEENVDELCFAHAEIADIFTQLSLRQSEWFVSDEDRFSMQALADLLRVARQRNVLTVDDLYLDEPHVIALLLSDPVLAARWQDYRRITGTQSGAQKPEGTYVVKIAAKKRSIDPLVQTSDGLRRFTTVNADYASKLAAFRADDFDRWVWAKYE